MTGRAAVRLVGVFALTVVLLAATPVLAGSGASPTGGTPPVGTAAATTTDGTELTVEATDASATDGGEVTVEITVTNEGDERAVAPVVSVGELPDGWVVVDNSSEEGTYRSSTREWLWFTLPPGESVTAAITIDVPEDATGVHEIPVTVDDRDNHSAETVAEIDAGSEGGSGLLAGALVPAAAVVGLLLVGAGAYLYRARGGGGGNSGGGSGGGAGGTGGASGGSGSERE